MIVLVMSSGVQNNMLGFDTLGFDFNRVFESSLYRVLVGAWRGENHFEEKQSDDDKKEYRRGGKMILGR